MPRRTLSLALSIACLAVLGGCDDEATPPSTIDGPVAENNASSEVSRRLCYQWETCKCDDAAGVSLAGCEQGLGFGWQATVEDAVEMGLTYDGECLAQRLNAMLERGCAGYAADNGWCGVTCQIYHGDKGLGEPCEGERSSSECQQGLICDFSEGCIEPPACVSFAPRALGASCVDAENRPVYPCAEGLCDGESGTCRALPGAGEPCLSFACAAEHWCESTAATPTCAALLQPGAPCTLPQSCASLACTDGACAPLPGAGEACAGACADGLACASDGTALVCQVPPGEGEACLLSGQHQCADGLVCAAQTQLCVSPPKRGEACPDYVCADDLACLPRLCSIAPSTPGCSACAEPEGCVVQVCGDPPAAVCGDSGGLLY